MKKLLLMTIALTTCLGAMAGNWTFPLPKHTPVEYGKTLYFYNTASMQFLTKGNNWGAQMSLGETGLPVIVREKADTEYTDGAAYVTMWNPDANGYYDWDANGRQGWVDRSEADATANEKALEKTIWKLKINDDGTFQFGIPNQAKTCEHPDFEEETGTSYDLWAGWNGYSGNTEVVPYLDTELYDGGGVVWIAMQEEDYKAQLPVISQRRSLYMLVVQADEAGVKIPAGVANALNNENATVDELQSASIVITNLVLKHEIDTKGEADVTAMYIVNPDLSSQNNGWSNSTGESWWNTDDWHIRPESVENSEDNVSMNNFICRFVWSGGWLGNLPNCQTSQTFTLPAGSYRLEADCVGFQEGDGADAYGSPQDWTGKVKGFYLFTKTELGEERAAIATNGKVPQHYSVEFLSAGGSATIGLKVDDAFGSFFGGDNFRLYCTSLISSPDIVELQNMADEMRTYVNAYADTPYSADMLDRADAFITDSEEIITADNVEACQPMIANGKVLLEAIREEIAAYAKVFEVHAETISHIERDDFDALGDEVVAKIREKAEAMFGYVLNGEVTATQALQLIVDYKSALARFIADDVNAIDEGLDATCLLTNGALMLGSEWYNGTGSQNVPGWNGERPTGYSPGSEYAKGQIEFLGQDFDFWQELPNMPAGVYTLEFRGFYRWGAKEDVVKAIGTADEDGKNTSCFYMNGIETKIKSITADAFPLSDDDDQHNSGNYETGTTDADGNPLYIPDANWYFMWRHRDCHINRAAIAIEEGDTLRIGFRASGEDNDRWSMISAPTLRYEGTSERAMAMLDPTAITAVEAASAATGVYNLNGQRISAPQRGISIVVRRQADGSLSTRKVLMK